MAAIRQTVLQGGEGVAAGASRAGRLVGQHAHFESISRRSDFHGLEAEWTALFERAGKGRQLFQSYNWLWHWANHFLAIEERKGTRLAICTGRIDGELVIVWPTVLEIKGPLRKLSWMGAPVSEYGDVLLDDIPQAKDVLAASFEYMRTRSGADLLDLRKVAADAHVAGLLLDLGFHKVKEQDARYIDARALHTIRDVPALHSRRMRQMQARSRKRFEAAGGRARAVTVQGFKAADLVRTSMFQKHFEAGAMHDPQALPSGIEAFLADVARGEERPVGCRVSALEANGVPAAIAIGFETKGTYLSYRLSFEAPYRKYSIASLLMEDLVESVCLEGRCNLDYLAPHSVFKARWSNWVIPVYAFEQPLSVLGQVYLRLRGGLIHQMARRTLQPA